MNPRRKTNMIRNSCKGSYTKIPEVIPEGISKGNLKETSEKMLNKFWKVYLKSFWSNLWRFFCGKHMKKTLPVFLEESLEKEFSNKSWWNIWRNSGMNNWNVFCRIPGKKSEKISVEYSEFMKQFLLIPPDRNFLEELLELIYFWIIPGGITRRISWRKHKRISLEWGIKKIKFWIKSWLLLCLFRRLQKKRF